MVATGVGALGVAAVAHRYVNRGPYVHRRERVAQKRYAAERADSINRELVTGRDVLLDPSNDADSSLLIQILNSPRLSSELRDHGEERTTASELAINEYAKLVLRYFRDTGFDDIDLASHFRDGFNHEVTFVDEDTSEPRIEADKETLASLAGVLASRYRALPPSAALLGNADTMAALDALGSVDHPGILLIDYAASVPGAAQERARANIAHAIGRTLDNLAAYPSVAGHLDSTLQALSLDRVIRVNYAGDGYEPVDGVPLEVVADTLADLIPSTIQAPDATPTLRP